MAASDLPLDMEVLGASFYDPYAREGSAKVSWAKTLLCVWQICVDS